jgi:uncharacterized protein (DUF2252 family)
MLVDVFRSMPVCVRAEQVIEFNRLQEKSRLLDLLPLRRQRMGASPFAFFRGSAGLMANDLRRQVDSGIQVQLCGDAHLMNFGFYASPERTLLFDINDFDETAPGPFEWDLKRLSVSAVLAARELGFDGEAQGLCVKSLAKRYRKSMAQYAEMNRLDVWYSRIRASEFIQELDGAHFAAYLSKVAAKALNNDIGQIVRRLCVDGVDGLRFNSGVSNLQACAEDQWMPSIADGYLETLRPEMKHLLSSFAERHRVLKVVGVGSVGRRCCLVLLQGDRPRDVMILQVKEAVASVLASLDSISAQRPVHQGQRVVEGQRLMQSASDPFLGWGLLRDGGHCYWRQFRDWKGSVALEKMDFCCLQTYVELCAHALAKSHARTGDCVAISQALQSTSHFPSRLACFAFDGADQVRLDFEAFLASGQ